MRGFDRCRKRCLSENAAVPRYAYIHRWFSIHPDWCKVDSVHMLWVISLWLSTGTYWHVRSADGPILTGSGGCVLKLPHLLLTLEGQKAHTHRKSQGYAGLSHGSIDQGAILAHLFGPFPFSPVKRMDPFGDSAAIRRLEPAGAEGGAASAAAPAAGPLQR